MFTSDTPIASPEDDILNRNEYAERLATTIIEWDKSDSIVFAINAKWGYGKSSLLNLVKHYVKKKTQTQSPKEFFKPRTKLHARMKFNGKRYSLLTIILGDLMIRIEYITRCLKRFQRLSNGVVLIFTCLLQQ